MSASSSSRSPAAPGRTHGALGGATDATGENTRARATQRRLLDGMIDAAAELGYAEVSVAQVLARGGAARSSFYARFTDKHDCFMAALGDVCARLEERVGAALADAQEPCAATVEAIVEFAGVEPASARLLFCESLAAGAQARAVRDQLIERLAASIESAWENAGPDEPGLDLPAFALIGGVFRLLALRLRLGVGGVHELFGDLHAWLGTYALARGPFLWRERVGLAAVEPIEAPEPTPIAMPGTLPRGRHSLSASEVAANQRTRLMYGLAQASFARGYAATGVTDVVAAAKLSREVFYAHFADKSQAALETLQMLFEQAMADAARAFFTAEPWPQRIWETATTLSGHFGAHPELANLVYVETHELGPAALPFVHHRMTAFAMLLEEGYRQPAAPELPRGVSEAITATALELGYLQAPRRDGTPTPNLLRHSVYMCIAPFVGPRAAGELIAQQSALGVPTASA